jgi:hypothetical protein
MAYGKFDRNDIQIDVICLTWQIDMLETNIFQQQKASVLLQSLHNF